MKSKLLPAGLLLAAAALIFGSSLQRIPPAPRPPQAAPVPPAVYPAIRTAIPGYQDYAGVVAQLREWQEQSAGWAETGTYGQSTRGQDLAYIAVHQPQTSGPAVLVTGCIHGNEPLATSTVMAFLGTMLATAQDRDVAEILGTRTMYFVPVVSPDSYPSSREVDGVDPNRDFPGPHAPKKKSVKPLAALQDFFQAKRPKAALSGHTFGRVFLIPWGDRNEPCPNAADYDRLTKDMVQLSDGYKPIRGCQMYSRPIMGTEVDWYYRHGALAMVWEFGTHQRKPSMQDVQDEFRRTYKAFLYFCKEAPKIQIAPMGAE